MRVLRGFMKAFAIILCVVLFFTCFAAVCATVAFNCLGADTISRLITDIDWSAFPTDGDQPRPGVDDYALLPGAAVPRGTLAGGARLWLPAAAGLSESGIIGEDVAGLLKQLLGEDGFEAVADCIETDEMKAFSEYVVDYISSCGITEEEFLAILQTDAFYEAVTELTGELIGLLMSKDRTAYDTAKIAAVVDRHAEGIRFQSGVEVEEEVFVKAKAAMVSVGESIAASKDIPSADELAENLLAVGLGEIDSTILYEINEILDLPADTSPIETAAALRRLAFKTVIALWAAVAVLIVLIAVLWWHLHRWLLPVGITLTASGCMTIIFSGVGNVFATAVSAANGIPLAEILDTMLFSRITLLGLAVFAAGLLCIAATIVLRIVFRRRPCPADGDSLPELSPSAPAVAVENKPQAFKG